MIGMRGAALVLAAVLGSAMPAAAQAGGTVTGLVVDSLGAAIAEVLVFVDQGPEFVATDAAGGFRLDGVEPGPHVLSFRRAGLAPRSFGLTVAAGAQERNVGAVRLQSGALPVADVTGRVTQRIDGAPLTGAIVRVNGTVIAQTDDTGTFVAPRSAVRWGPNEVVITHSGVQQTSATDQFWILGSDERIDLEISLGIAPIPVRGVNVASTRSERLQGQGFYERRAAGSNAIFYTADDIRERQFDDWQDLLRGVRFTRTRAFTTFGDAADPAQGQCGTTDAPIAFLDGGYVGTLNELVATVRVETIEGVEIYRGVANLPVAFNRMGAECGVIVVWSRGTL